MVQLKCYPISKKQGNEPPFLMIWLRTLTYHGAFKMVGFFFKKKERPNHFKVDFLKFVC